MSTPKQSHHYDPLTARMALQLSAPHTWPAAILPVLVACALASIVQPMLSVTLIGALLVIVVLMQAAVNTLNDYYDFVKGADNEKNQLDPTDAVLVYNNVNPKSALALVVGLLVCAFGLGTYVVWNAGWIPLAIGVVGAVILVLYSAGSSPISYLPIGELVSGFTMGSLIMLACYQALTGTFDLIVLLFSLPLLCGIGLILMTNNTCDIEKDIEVHRKTLSVLLGRERARKTYHTILGVQVASIIIIIAIFFPSGSIIMPFMLLAAYPVLSALIKNPLTASTRGSAMSQILNTNIALGAFYALAILMSSTTILVI